LTKDSLRKCIGCGELISRDSMIKITKEHSTGEVIVNPDSKTFGRSVYLCYNQNCIESAFKKNKINKILKTNISIDKNEVLKLL
jgi:predicted RNA-binding protein YlxR (DUF448 family)